jgi:hypothetical protein
MFRPVDFVYTLLGEKTMNGFLDEVQPQIDRAANAEIA